MKEKTSMIFMSSFSPAVETGYCQEAGLSRTLWRIPKKARKKLNHTEKYGD